MPADSKLLQKSVQRKRGLMGRLGDAGRFLGELVRGKDLSAGSVRAKIGEMERYIATCFDQIEEVGDQWQQTDQQLAQLKGKLKEAGRATRSTLLAQAEVLLRRGDAYHNAIDKLKTNGMAAQILVEKLRDLLILTAGPMPEDAIDRWTTQLDAAITERGMTDKALEELQKTAERWVAENDRDSTPEQVAVQLEQVEVAETDSDRERAVEKQLQELFDV